jgi:hypothetical protein
VGKEKIIVEIDARLTPHAKLELRKAENFYYKYRLAQEMGRLKSDRDTALVIAFVCFVGLITVILATYSRCRA